MLRRIRTLLGNIGRKIQARHTFRSSYQSRKQHKVEEFFFLTFERAGKKWTSLHFSYPFERPFLTSKSLLEFPRRFFNNNRMSNQIVNLDKVGKSRSSSRFFNNSLNVLSSFLRPFRRCSKGWRKRCSRWLSSHSNSAKKRQKNSDHHPGSLLGVWPQEDS